MGTTQDQALVTEWIQQNQALFSRCTTVDGALKHHIITAIQPVFFSPLVDQLTRSVQVNALQMLHRVFNSYGEIYEIDLEENTMKMIGLYDPAESLA